MPMKTSAYAANDNTGIVTPLEIERRDVVDKDVQIRIKYCGICHSDLHQMKSEWAGTRYPCCAGHEIVGEVEKVGPGVTKFKAGDIVGVGCMVDSCRECDQCKQGLEQYCPKVITTYNGVLPDGTHTYGGYSTHVVVTEDFVVRVPTNLDLAATAPLLCAGSTCYTPLRLLEAGPGKVVGMLGMGGLGHVGVKIAKAMGCEVVVISRNKGKEKEALKMGASRVLISTDAAQMKAAAKTIDFILDTVSGVHDFEPMLGLLKTGGTLVAIGVPGVAMPLDLGWIVSRHLNIMGSCIAGMPFTQEMLDFCGKHNITADIELIPADYINKAMERLAASDVRYRFVIDIEKTLPLAK